MKVKLYPLTASILREMTNRTFGDLASLMMPASMPLEAVVEHTTGWAGYGPDGTVVGAGGLIPLWAQAAPNQVATAWVMVDRDQPMRVRLSMLYQIRRILQAAINEDYARIEANVMASDKTAIDLIEALGFERVGLRERWGPDGQDFILYDYLK